MKNCGYCDYYKTGENTGESAGAGTGMALCSFTNILFFTDFDKSQSEYLCRDMTYPEYLASRENQQLPSRLGREDWKLLYKSKHTVLERIRSRNPVMKNQTA